MLTETSLLTCRERAGGSAGVTCPAGLVRFVLLFLRLPAMLILAFSLLVPGVLIAQGTVYMVLGSDTAIWEGMDTGREQPHYSLDLFLNPQRNAFRVMDPQFRSRFRDSYGQAVKLTWWMMAGNIFGAADNTDVPLANTMTMYLMQKYQGDAVHQLGDELSLHYHTFAWTDYNGDGKFYWNQAHSFAECREDFDRTLAQYLLEEGVFPVSFRSGWHYMDNGWQEYLNELLPYTLHNDHPHIRQTSVEPIDNVFDWSQAPSAFVPYVPSRENYQLPGARTPGVAGTWNTRSIHLGSVNQSLMDQIFSAAEKGSDQVPCLWGHLPEEDFLANIARIDSLAHTSAVKYPAVRFRYCTATEAMRRWRGVTDSTAPRITVYQAKASGWLQLDITVDEPIIQGAPFVAVKDIYERYTVLPVTTAMEGAWHYSSSLPAMSVAKIAVAATDTSGNLSMEVIRFLPDDQYIDNGDAGYAEVSGSWATSVRRSWGTDSRTAALAAGSDAAVRWEPTILRTGRYNLFYQVPAAPNMAGNLHFRFLCNGSLVDSAAIDVPPADGGWTYLGSPLFQEGARNEVELTVPGAGQEGKIVAADVLRVSPLVRDRQIVLKESRLDLGPVPEGDTLSAALHIGNQGIAPLRITSIRAGRPALSVSTPVPIDIQPGRTSTVGLSFVVPRLQAFPQEIVQDSLIVASDDPLTPECVVRFTAVVEPYFATADNDDARSYQEAGEWGFSVAQAFGHSSRISYLDRSPGASATFSLRLREEAAYDVLQIVPQTVNAATKAHYTISLNGTPVDSLVLNQNTGSGGWVKLGQYTAAAGSELRVTVSKVPGSGGAVLRADAIKAAKVMVPNALAGTAAGVPLQFGLAQNYPNPFNPSTTLTYALGEGGMVRLSVYDLLGREVEVLVNERQMAGSYSVHFDGSALPSGTYFARLRAEPGGTATGLERHSLTPDGRSGVCVQTRRMVLIR